jgi:hypothetical protein
VPPKGETGPVVINGPGLLEEKVLKDKKTLVSKFDGQFVENVREGYATKAVY